jgi:hypothetical protein
MWLFFAIFVIHKPPMKKAISFTIGFIAIAMLITMFSGCYMFHKKNRCGDCPKWKIELSETVLKNTLF